MLRELLDLIQARDLRDADQRVEPGMLIGSDLLCELRGRPVVDEVPRLGPELPVIPQDVVGPLLEGLLRIVPTATYARPATVASGFPIAAKPSRMPGVRSAIAVEPAVP